MKLYLYCSGPLRSAASAAALTGLLIHTPPAIADGAAPLAGRQQLVVATTADWDAPNCTLQRFARATGDDAWAQVGSTVDCVVGRRGLGWGRGVHPVDGLEGPQKREGDKKAPAGVFEIGPAFGYAKRADEFSVEYLPIDDSLECVDDPTDGSYNQLVRVEAPTDRTWDSSEFMKRPDGQYRWGAVVLHNQPAPVAGAGSCIFLHVWRRSGSGTAGCTAMQQDALTEILRWLSPEARPALVQLPRPEYVARRTAWDLP